MHEPDDRGIHSWPPTGRPFVRVTTTDGETLYGRAARWKGHEILVDFPAPPDDVWGNWSAWIDSGHMERIPGTLPECAPCRLGGDDDPDVLWSPNQCAWPRDERVRLYGAVNFFPRDEAS